MSTMIICYSEDLSFHNEMLLYFDFLVNSIFNLLITGYHLGHR